MEPDWETNLQVCDMVRGQEATFVFIFYTHKHFIPTDLSTLFLRLRKN